MGITRRCFQCKLSDMSLTLNPRRVEQSAVGGTVQYRPFNTTTMQQVNVDCYLSITFATKVIDMDCYSRVPKKLHFPQVRKIVQRLYLCFSRFATSFRYFIKITTLRGGRRSLINVSTTR